MKVIFLDIDGVLITAETCRQGYGIVDRDCVEQLNKLLRQTGAYIVLSSCWRTGRTRIECADLLSEWGVCGTVVDRTGPSIGNIKRGLEIQAWLTEHNAIGRDPVESFVIIDDDVDMAHLLPRLVHTHFGNGPGDKEAGFREKHIAPARALLETPCEAS